MAYINVPEGMPGISGLLASRPETAAALNIFTEQLLRGSSTLTSGERELIAAYVSQLNQCAFCARSHIAAAAHLPGYNAELVEQVLQDVETAEISEKMKALLAIAAKVQKDAHTVTEQDIARARNAGATDTCLHDAVLVAAAFCMFNRYVDGLGTYAPSEQLIYNTIGERLANNGYAPNSNQNI